MSTKRKNYSPQFKAKVALAALKNDELIAELRRALRGWFSFYNQERFHQALDNRTPDEVYYGLPHPFAEAA